MDYDSTALPTELPRHSHGQSHGQSHRGVGYTSGWCWESSIAERHRMNAVRYSGAGAILHRQKRGQIDLDEAHGPGTIGVHTRDLAGKFA